MKYKELANRVIIRNQDHADSALSQSAAERICGHVKQRNRVPRRIGNRSILPKENQT